ncbi:LuxR C-terminal-related transcriptional regulator [Micromonospora sp. NIE79]|uniref:LuxR C-terminal-related transcriptional regulator n=1 Tax=Micromonospora trifolii TaxID=2911208 RepID=A0ABS9MVH1_9ACTN|nr:LuxR C-terminal-related transcriptional regulator [Micromonospora trifolii]MCG5441385.1 LuxR C-terminal-related transcriptional regulator [Micromonospora trifolii]
MIMNDLAAPGLILDKGLQALLDAVAQDPTGPLAVGIAGPAGHGKTALLAELERIHQRAGIAVRTAAPEPDEPVDPDTVVLVDDAHLLDDARTEALLRLVAGRRHRLVVAHRPWPRSAAFSELVDALRRDGQAVLLTPFTREQTAAHLAATPELGRPADLVDFVHTQTAGVPRDVERLARGLAGAETRTGVVEPPRSVILEFGPDLEVQPAPVRRLLLAVAVGGALPVSMLGALLGRDPAGVDELIATTRAAGLLGADGRLAPIVRRAVATLSPTTERTAVWRRLTELQLARGGAVLPLVRSLLAVGALGDCPAATLAAAADEALADEPAFAAKLFAAATAAGRPPNAQQALAAALAGDLDDALRLADRLLGTAAPPERSEAAVVAATALAHRGHVGRSVELFRWSGTASAAAFAIVGGLAAGDPDASTESPAGDPAGEPPTLHASAARLMANGVRESVTGPPTAALSALVQAAALLEPDGRAALLPDSPAALAALTAVHCGELEIAERVLHRALGAGVGGPLMARRHRLLQAWILMVRGEIHAAGERLATVTLDGRPLESRDQLFAAAIRMGIGRRNSDLGALKRGWGQALEAVVRHPVDLFTLLPLGELAIAGARLGDLARLEPYLHQGRALLHRLGDPPLWSVPLHWSELHAAILTGEPTVADEHVAALLAAAGHSRYAAVVAAAAESWVEVLRGVVDPTRVEAAARGLHDTGLCWDGARLAGQAAIRTADRRAMTTLLECARALQGRPSGGQSGQTPTTGASTARAAGPTQHGLSDREYEVAELVLAGLTYREIGDRLFISAKTVEHHVARMRNRLNCANRTELLALLRTLVADRASDTAGQPWPQRASR